jgi:glycerophosphoryl diester phosphodiesterase
MRIFAHRGHHRDAPENTLESFHAARDLGVAGIETDVRLDKHGVAILFHDRTVRAGVPVASLSAAELRSIVGYHIPTLDEALTQVNGITWNLEIKDPAALPMCVAAIKRYAASSAFFVSSFFHDAVLQCAALVDVECGLLISHRPADPLALFANTALPSRVKTLVWYYGTLDRAAIGVLHSNGVSSMIYGFAAPGEHRGLAHPGVTALITDFPGDP